MPARKQENMRVYCRRCGDFREYKLDAKGGCVCLRCGHFAAGFRPVVWYKKYVQGGTGREGGDADA